MRKVIDNFLPLDDLECLQSTLLGFNNGFPWQLSVVVTPDAILECDELNNWQLCHYFYNKGTSLSKNPTVTLITPLIERLQPETLIRVKANLNPRTDKINIHAYHTDIPNEQVTDLCKTAVFYVNTNDGYTIFEDDGEKVPSLANRLVMFDATQSHSGTTCTNEQFRCVININWI
jgi:hypothetical protein